MGDYIGGTEHYRKLKIIVVMALLWPFIETVGRIL